MEFNFDTEEQNLDCNKIITPQGNYISLILETNLVKLRM